MNATALARPTSRPSKPRERGIVIREPIPQVQQAEVEASDGNKDPEHKRKGKIKLTKPLWNPLEIPLPLHLEEHGEKQQKTK